MKHRVEIRITGWQNSPRNLKVEDELHTFYEVKCKKEAEILASFFQNEYENTWHKGPDACDECTGRDECLD